VQPSRRRQHARRASARSAGHRSGNEAPLGELLLSLYRGVREPDGWLTFQQHLSNSLGTINSVLSLRWPENARAGLLYTFNADATQLPPHLRAYATIDPFVNIAEGRAVRLLDLVDTADFRASTYYREWLVPINVEYALGLDVRETGRFHARLRLCRSKSAGEFSDDDCRLVESLAPHLRLAVGLYSDLDEARSGRELYADAMDSLAFATLVLDEHGRMVHSNRLAQQVFAERDGISASRDEVVLASREDSRRFHELVMHAVQQFSSNRPTIVQAMRVSRPSGRPAYELVVRPSPVGVLGGDSELNARVAVVIGSDAGRSAPSGLSAEAVQQFFGLTRKEAELALRLAAGRSLLDAARDQGISLNTARAHLRSIFAKTGIDRQSRLVSALLKSAARAARQEHEP
jgi:DNA-binding CsgD family transcriptional regulator/PAS domain-containing protein